MSKMKKPEKANAIPVKKITTKNKPGATGPGGDKAARERQTTDSNNK
jgi:hypothetical protein